MHRRQGPKLTRTCAQLTLALLPAAIATAQTSTTPSGIETIVVTDRAIEREISLTAGGITLIDTEELRERNTASLADLLRFAPGIWAQSTFGSDAVFISSRGSNLDATDYDGNGITMLQDGLRVTAADGNNHNRFVDPLSARFATVARGANALRYGATTLGGAIEFTSPTARTSEPLEVFVNGGSNGQLQARGTIGNVFSDKTDGLLTLETKRWDGYRDHSEQERSGLYANFGWRPSDRTESRFFLNYVDNDQQLPGGLTRAQFETNPGMANPAALTGDFKLNVESTRFANRTVVQLSERDEINFGFSLEEQTLYHPIVDVRVDFDGPGPGLPVTVFGLLINTDHRDVGGMFRYNHRGDTHDVVVGLNYGRSNVEGGNYWNDGGNRGFLMTAVDNSAATLAVYGLDRWKASDKLMVELGAQAVSADRDVVNIDADTGAVRNPNDTFSRITPRAGLIYSAGNGLDLFANVSGLYEPPTNYELEDEDTGSNAILDAMRGTVLEVGTRGMSSNAAGRVLSWEVALYYAQIKNEIMSRDDPSAPGNSLSTNIDNTIHAGIEAGIGAQFPLRVAGGGAIAPRLSLTINEFTFDGDPTYGDNDLPSAPGYVLRGEVLYRHADGFFVGPTFDVVDGRYADFMNTYRVDSYSLLGLRAGWGSEKWSVFLDAVNLTDENYVAHLSVRDFAAPNAEILQPGSPRSFYVGLQGRF